MKLLLAATLVLMLSAIAIAVPDSQMVGPYTVSFDLNANYKAQYALPIETETANTYQMRLFVDDSTFAVIGITDYAEPTDATLKVHKGLMPLNLIKKGLNVTNVEDRTIDGKEGFLVTSMPFGTNNPASSGVYTAMYWLDSKVSVGNTCVIIASTFPKDVTERLLSSLHIMKGKAAA